jgi:hypothetical protein
MLATLDVLAVGPATGALNLDRRIELEDDAGNILHPACLRHLVEHQGNT